MRVVIFLGSKQPSAEEARMILKGTEVSVRRARGKLVVQLLNRTPKGVKYIADEITLSEDKMSDKNFKADLAAKIAELPSRTP